MRAACFTGLGRPLELREVETRPPGPGEVAVRVRHCGICGSDLHMATDPVFRVEPGAILGHEYSGEIVAVGEGVDGLRPGERVAVLPVDSCGRCRACLSGEPADCPDKRLSAGGFAERAVVKAAQCFRLPEGMTTQTAALAEPLAVGLHGVMKAGMRPGARVMVIGAGPIGLVTIYWARRLGAGRIAATASSHRRAELAVAMGADVFLGPETSAPEGVAEALGGMADIVFECAGKPGLIDRAVGLIRRGGTVAALGLVTGPDTLDSLEALRKEARIQMAGYFTVAEFQTSLAALVADGEAIGRMVTSRIPLAAMPQAFEELKREKSQCKVMVETG